MNIDLEKSLKAKIFDYDKVNYDESPEYIIVDIQAIVLPHKPYTNQVELLYNGGKSHNFEIIPQN